MAKRLRKAIYEDLSIRGDDARARQRRKVYRAAKRAWVRRAQ